MRQVQAHEAPGGHLRQVRRRGHPGQGPARAARAHRAGHPRQPRLVLQGVAEPDRAPARHLAPRPRAHPLLRELRRDRPRRQRVRGAAAAHGRAVPEGAGRARPEVQGPYGGRGHQGAAQARRRPRPRGTVAGGHAPGDLGAEEAEVRQAPEGRRRVPEVEQPPGVDDPRRDSGHSARTAPPRPPRRGPLRDVRPQRPLPPGDQPQQPPEEADGAQGARRHHPQREADAAGGGRRAVRQRPARPGAARGEQPPPQVAVGHAQG